MNNYQQPGDVLSFIAPTGGVVVGVPERIGDVFVIPQETAAALATFRGYVTGVFELVKDAGTAWAAGQPLYFDVSANEVTHDSSLGPYLGYATEVTASAAVLGDVNINRPSLIASQGLQTIRQRFTIAQVNAGVELLPAVPGRRYSMVSASLMAFGGAATSVTTVDIVGVQTTPVLLVAGGVAALLEDIMIKDAHTGGVILAAGLSYVPNDADTAITLDITGSDITVATHIDVHFQYTLGI